MINSLDGANVLILGGTGSLGKRLFYRIVGNELGTPASLTVFSRDEAKQHEMRLALLGASSATDEVIYRESAKRVQFAIGDVRRYAEMRRAIDRADIILHAAALKQVPTCEYFAGAAVETNIQGALNLVRAVRESSRTPKVVVGVSTDKACKPVNVMGMTKALQERILSQANLEAPWSRFVNVRYGNVMASRGSAIPFFIDLARQNKPIPITDSRMTRFLMTLDESVSLVFAAVRSALPGETYLPTVPSAKVTDLARAAAGSESYPLSMTSIRPGEKIHEVLISEEETPRTLMRGQHLVIQPILPELRSQPEQVSSLPFQGEYSSADHNLSFAEVRVLLERHGLTATTTSPSPPGYP
jgi:FlaA1/EpsC-like NDP-sugar epimerase